MQGAAAAAAQVARAAAARAAAARAAAAHAAAAHAAAAHAAAPAAAAFMVRALDGGALLKVSARHAAVGAASELTAASRRV